MRGTSKNRVPRCVRSDQRRGHSSVEYAILVGLVTLLTIGLAYFADLAFHPLRHDIGSLSSHLVPDEPVRETANTRRESVGMTTAESALLSVIACAGIGSICLIGRSFRVSTNLRRVIRQDQGGTTSGVDFEGALREKIHEKRELLLSEMTDEIAQVVDGRFEVWHLMSTKMKTIAPDMPADKIRKLITERNMHHLLVCQGSQLLGVISDRDVAKKPNARTAAELMTRDPITVHSKQCLSETISAMINRRISCLPVVDDGVLQGVLTRTDLLVGFQCILQVLLKFHQQANRPKQA